LGEDDGGKGLLTVERGIVVRLTSILSQRRKGRPRRKEFSYRGS